LDNNTNHAERGNGSKMNLKTVLELLEIIDRQNTLIAQLVNENFEQENFIHELMKNHVRDDVQLSE